MSKKESAVYFEQMKKQKKEVIKGDSVKKQNDTGIKRPLSSFFVYLDKRKREILAEKPGIARKEIAKIAGQEWR